VDTISIGDDGRATITLELETYVSDTGKASMRPVNVAFSKGKGYRYTLLHTSDGNALPLWGSWSIGVAPFVDQSVAKVTATPPPAATPAVTPQYTVIDGVAYPIATQSAPTNVRGNAKRTTRKAPAS
jgi:hypothetical protein